jgi:Leucine-rich repeat (LRR) protein
LVLDGSSMSTLPKSAESMRHLRILSLANTQVEKLPCDMVKMRELKELNIEGTQISSLPLGLGGHLDRINAKNSRLTVLPRGSEVWQIPTNSVRVAKLSLSDADQGLLGGQDSYQLWSIRPQNAQEVQTETLDSIVAEIIAELGGMDDETKWLLQERASGSTHLTR